MRRLLAFSIVFSAICFSAGRASAQSPDRDVEVSGRRFIDARTQKAINDGLEWLAARQNNDGSFGLGGQYQKNVAVVSLAGMAFLSQGSTPGRGRYGAQIEKCADFVLAATRPDGFISIRASSSHGPLYGHGFATLFLAEIHGMYRRQDLKPKLKRAVDLIVSAQNKEGGWRYFPDSNDADVSVTVCQIMALRAARNAGIFVPTDTVNRCTQYIKRAQNSDGGFRYQLTRARESGFPRSAAGLVALFSAGIYEGREIDSALEYLSRQIPRANIARNESHYFYGHYYAMQAMWHTGGDHWDRWYPAVRDDLIGRQKDNHWSHHTIGAEYATAMACIALQVPNNYLPIFQR